MDIEGHGSQLPKVLCYCRIAGSTEGMVPAPQWLPFLDMQPGKLFLLSWRRSHFDLQTRTLAGTETHPPFQRARGPLEAPTATSACTGQRRGSLHSTGALWCLLNSERKLLHRYPSTDMRRQAKGSDKSQRPHPTNF